MKLSLHRALAELKMLNKRINAAINGGKYVSYQIGEEKPKGFQSKEAFEKDAAADYQSVTDLIKRRNEIKSKLILANATTKVEIAGVQMTIAEAIDHKEFIEYKRSLLNELKRQLSLTNQMIEREKLDMEIRLDKRIESDLGSKDRKNHVQEVEEITNNFKKRYNPSEIDPIGIREEIKKLETEIYEFELEVDAVLSEINAITMIELAA
ncbi:hypothetical protein ABWK22_01775 [Gottfriedia acidiceleris]|uniref:hypothetical protein n=1 Tax=Gottfriedia acidiceleris TaxID=371036 RepID=UPI0033984031